MTITHWSEHMLLLKLFSTLLTVCCVNCCRYSISPSFMALQDKSIDELCDYLSTEITDISEDVLSNFRMHKIDGNLFLQLNEEYLREIAPLVGDRMKLKKVLSVALEPFPATPITSPCQYDSPNQSTTPLITPTTSYAGDDSYIEVKLFLKYSVAIINFISGCKLSQ